jgi:hypothetical protein
METFPISPASARTLWWLWAIVALVLSVGALLAYTAWSTRHVRVELDADSLRIRGDLFGRRIPRSELELGQATLVSLDRDSEYRLRWRSFGTGLPGYAAGWFHLANGERALVFVTDAQQVVHIPTHSGWSLMLGVSEPERFMQALRASRSG